MRVVGFPSACSGAAGQFPYAEGYGKGGKAVGLEGAAQASPVAGRRRAGVGVVNKCVGGQGLLLSYNHNYEFGIEHRKTMHDLQPLDACPYRPNVRNTLKKTI